MRKLTITLFILTFTGFLLQSCQSPEDKQLKKIKVMESELFGNINNIIDQNKAFELTNKYVAFATDYPDHEMAPEFLFRAGDMSMNTGYPERAIDLYSRVHSEYPGYSKHPESLFLIAFIYENQLMNLPRAERIYQQFIDLYPDHDLAKDAQVLLQHLGKSPDEIVREFEERMRARDSL